MALERATYLTVDGDVGLHSVRVDGMDMATHVRIWIIPFLFRIQEPRVTVQLQTIFWTTT